MKLTKTIEAFRQFNKVFMSISPVRAMVVIAARIPVLGIFHKRYLMWCFKDEVEVMTNDRARRI